MHGPLNVYHYYYYYIIIDVISTNSVLVIGSTTINDEVSQYDSSRCTLASGRAPIGFKVAWPICYTHYIFTSNHLALCYTNCVTDNRLLNRPITLHNTRNQDMSPPPSKHQTSFALKYTERTTQNSSIYQPNTAQQGLL